MCEPANFSSLRQRECILMKITIGSPIQIGNRDISVSTAPSPPANARAWGSGLHEEGRMASQALSFIPSGISLPDKLVPARLWLFDTLLSLLVILHLRT
jgi:hypothetical protein